MKDTGYGRYGIDFGRLVRQLVPSWLRGQNAIRFLQACVSPLQSLSDGFREWAQQVRIDASMTSQVFKLEWYFARMFGKGKVRIVNFASNTNPCYYRDALSADKNQLLCQYRADYPSSHLISPVYYMDDAELAGASFVVAISSSLKGREAEIEGVLARYNTVNKTYKITYI